MFVKAPAFKYDYELCVVCCVLLLVTSSTFVLYEMMTWQRESVSQDTFIPLDNPTGRKFCICSMYATLCKKLLYSPEIQLELHASSVLGSHVALPVDELNFVQNVFKKVQKAPFQAVPYGGRGRGRRMSVWAACT